MNYTGLIFILLFAVYVIATSVRNILIGVGRIKHPMYDNEEKQKHIFRLGVLGFVLSVVGGGFLLFIFILILF